MTTREVCVECVVGDLYSLTNYVHHFDPFCVFLEVHIRRIAFHSNTIPNLTCIVPILLNRDINILARAMYLLEHVKYNKPNSREANLIIENIKANMDKINISDHLRYESYVLDDLTRRAVVDEMKKHTHRYLIQ